MAGSRLWQRFVSEFRLRTAEPASEQQLSRLEKALGGTLPAKLRDLYLLTNGGKARHHLSDLELLSIHKALQYRAIPPFFQRPWGFVPLAENSDSNLISYSTAGPLAGYIVHVSHDEAPRLLCRSISELLQMLLDAIQDGSTLDIATMPSVFARPERTERDRATARKILSWLQEAKITDEVERNDAVIFACDLLADSELDEFQELTRLGGQASRDHLATRAADAAAPETVQQLQAIEDDYDQFVTRCHQQILAAEIPATIQSPYGKATIRLEKGPVWLNMEQLFEERQSAGFEEDFLRRVKALVPQKKARAKTATKKATQKGKKKS